MSAKKESVEMDVVVYDDPPKNDEEKNGEVGIVDPGCCGRISGYIADPFPGISDKTLQRTADIYLPIPGALLSLGASISFAAKAPPLISGIFTLFGATATMAGKVVSGTSDRRMLKQPIKVAREAGIDEEALAPKGFVEFAADHANIANFCATIVSIAGIILGGLFLFGVIFNHDANNDPHSSGKDTDTFSDKEILGIILSIVTLVDNCLKLLKGCEIERRDRMTQLTKDHKKQVKEHKKQVKEKKTWLPEILQRRQVTEGFIEVLRIFLEKSDSQREDDMETKELYSKCIEFLTLLNNKQVNLEIKEIISKRLSSEPFFLDELKKIEAKLLDIRQELYGSLPEEQRNRAINLWEKSSIIPPLYRVRSLKEYVNFLCEVTEKQDHFTQEKHAQYRMAFVALRVELQSIKSRLTEITKSVLDDIQEKETGFNMQGLRDKIEKLDNQDLYPGLSVSNVGMR